MILPAECDAFNVRGDMMRSYDELPWIRSHLLPLLRSEAQELRAGHILTLAVKPDFRLAQPKKLRSRAIQIARPRLVVGDALLSVSPWWLEGVVHVTNYRVGG